eukprot:6990784-Prorocentrum_lima.AAC.1
MGQKRKFGGSEEGGAVRGGYETPNRQSIWISICLAPLEHDQLGRDALSSKQRIKRSSLGPEICEGVY